MAHGQSTHWKIAEHHTESKDTSRGQSMCRINVGRIGLGRSSRELVVGPFSPTSKPTKLPFPWKTSCVHINLHSYRDKNIYILYIYIYIHIHSYTTYAENMIYGVVQINKPDRASSPSSVPSNKCTGSLGSPTPPMQLHRPWSQVMREIIMELGRLPWKTLGFKWKMGCTMMYPFKMAIYNRVHENRHKQPWDTLFSQPLGPLHCNLWWHFRHQRRRGGRRALIHL